MLSLLFVCHAPSENTRRLRDAAVTGAGISERVQLIVRDSLTAGPEDVLAADALLIGTTENFGSIAGLTKDFFERIYYPCEATEGKPFAAFVRAGQDGQGSLLAIERITTGLRWRAVQPPLLLHGSFSESFVEQVSTLAATLSAGLEAGIY
ncbi:MAG: NAD(P)H-dependent oxidoreductase [Pseudomonadota bacterium]